MFDSGRLEHATRGVVGINQDLEVFQGFEAQFPPIWFETDILTFDERIELADYMISLWEKFKQP